MVYAGVSKYQGVYFKQTEDFDMNGNDVWTKQYSGFREIFDYIKEILENDFEITDVTEDAFKMKI